MASTFKKENGDWTRHRQLPGVAELDLHHEGRRPHNVSYDDVMSDTRDQVLEFLKTAQAAGKRFALIVHGHSTSRLGKTTKRSVVRRLMHDKDATPFILRSECIEDNTAFVAAIRPKARTADQ